MKKYALLPLVFFSMSSFALNVYSLYKYKEDGYSGEIKITQVSSCEVQDNLGCSTREVLKAEINTVNDQSGNLCDLTIYENDYARITDRRLLTTSFVSDSTDPNSQSSATAKFSGKTLIISPDKSDFSDSCGVSAGFFGKYVASGKKIQLN